MFGKFYNLLIFVQNPVGFKQLNANPLLAPLWQSPFIKGVGWIINRKINAVLITP
jgi:hypothetical protein